MQDKLLKVCFIISVSGILLLLFMSDNMQPRVIEISSIDKGMLEKSVSIQGRVVSEKNLGGGNFKVFGLCNDAVCIPVALNSKENATISFLGKDIVVIGKVSEYKNELQINADKIIEIKEG